MHTTCLPTPATFAINHCAIRQAIKQTIEFSLVLLTLPLWLPVCIIIYMLILIEDGKNPLFVQDRVGKNGHIFRTFKFRTMVVNAEEVLKKVLEENEELRLEWDTFYKLRKDPRITRIGRFLRTTSLDELPQLLNVLLGDMVLVGPRPLTTYHQEALPQHVQELRNSVKPGITGLWQVSGRSDAGTEGMKQWDPYYVRNWSIAMDFSILLRTVKVVIAREGAY